MSSDQAGGPDPRVDDVVSVLRDVDRVTRAPDGHQYWIAGWGWLDDAELAARIVDALRAPARPADGQWCMTTTCIECGRLVDLIVRRHRDGDGDACQGSGTLAPPPPVELAGSTKTEVVGPCNQCGYRGVIVACPDETGPWCARCSDEGVSGHAGARGGERDRDRALAALATSWDGNAAEERRAMNRPSVSVDEAVSGPYVADTWEQAATELRAALASDAEGDEGQ